MGSKKAPTSFSPANLGISPKSLLTFSFKSFATLALNFKVILSVSPKSLNLTKSTSQKNLFF